MTNTASCGLRKVLTTVSKHGNFPVTAECRLPTIVDGEHGKLLAVLQIRQQLDNTATTYSTRWDPLIELSLNSREFPRSIIVDTPDACDILVTSFEDFACVILQTPCVWHARLVVDTSATRQTNSTCLKVSSILVASSSDMPDFLVTC